MLSIVMSGLNVSQKSLDVTANNLANAGTVGFKRSEASFLDVFANDAATGSRVAVGSGAAIGAIERSTSQGQLQTTDSVTDLAIAGRGYFTMLARDEVTQLTDTLYTRAGNFNINSKGEICDSQGNLLQCFKVDDLGNVSKTLQSAVIETQKSSGTATVLLGPNAVLGTQVSLKVSDTNTLTHDVTQPDIDAGFVTFSDDSLTTTASGSLKGTYPYSEVRVPLPLGSGQIGQTIQLMQGGTVLTSKVLTSLNVRTDIDGSSFVSFDRPLLKDGDLALLSANQIENGISTAMSGIISELSPAPLAQGATEFRGIFVQSLSVSSKGMIQENYSDGTKRTVGAIALATFPNEAGLKPIGNTDFVACEASGGATLTQAGAPYAGDIHSGTLEQANVDITQELMGMLKAQQIYNGNARMMQTAIEVTQRITDKI